MNSLASYVSKVCLIYLQTALLVGNLLEQGGPAAEETQRKVEELKKEIQEKELKHETSIAHLKFEISSLHSRLEQELLKLQDPSTEEGKQKFEKLWVSRMEDFKKNTPRTSRGPVSCPSRRRASSRSRGPHSGGCCPFESAPPIDDDDTAPPPNMNNVLCLLREVSPNALFVRIDDLEANGIGLHLDRALDGGHEINCLGLGPKCSKSRTSRMGIESPVETCTKSRIHWMSAAFHRPQTWVVYAILVGWID
ncbi:UNVERIFIED_CONTAM: hypothetical protein Sradi_3001100 [Sesamum radiatum]|uniref:Uncharacterized protein n=1 Tax=Sesamum radiatum TaxID=300843 RepID=A0AAW2S0U0_SESRA